MGNDIVKKFLVGIIILSYFAVFSTLSLLKHYSLHSTYLDLGLESQIVWNTSQGRFMESSFGPNGEIISALSFHISPISALLILSASFLMNYLQSPSPLYRFPIAFESAEYVVLDPEALENFDLSQVTLKDYQGYLSKLMNNPHYRKKTDLERLLVFEKIKQ